MKKIKVIIADDHTMFRDGLKASFNSSNNIEVVAEAGDGWGVIDKLKDTDCDVIIIDVNMPGIDGIETAKLIKGIKPGAKILLLTMHDNKNYLMDAFSVGVHGYILKMAKVEKLFYAVEQISKGEIYFDPDIAKSLPPVEEGDFSRQAAEYFKEDYNLTQRETEILLLLVSGYSAAEISKTIRVSESTVNNHRHRIFKKLGVKNIVELVKLALSRRLKS